MRLVFIAPEEPLILPLFFERAVPALRDDEVAIAVVSPIQISTPAAARIAPEPPASTASSWKIPRRRSSSRMRPW